MWPIEDAYVRRVHGSGAAEGEVADFVCVCSASHIGTWGPVSAVETILVVGLLLEQLVGKTPRDALETMRSARGARHVSGHLTMACTACDLAVRDLMGKEEGVPVSVLLGNPCRDRVQTYISLLGSDLPEPARLRDLVRPRDRYWGVKWPARLGPEHGQAGIERTIGLLRQIRSDGPGRQMVEAGGRWTVSYARSFLAAAADLDLAWVEEPLPPNDLAGYRQLRKLAAAPIAAGEHAYCLADAGNLIDCGVSVLQPDAAWCGGLDVFAAIIDLADDANLPVFPHGAGLLPALHVALHHSPKVVPAIEYHATMEPRRQLFWLNKFAPREGWLSAPSEAGLGIRIDEDLVGEAHEFRALQWLSHGKH